MRTLETGGMLFQILEHGIPHIMTIYTRDILLLHASPCKHYRRMLHKILSLVRSIIDELGDMSVTFHILDRRVSACFGLFRVIAS